MLDALNARRVMGEAMISVSAVASRLVRGRVGWTLAIVQYLVIIYWFRRGEFPSSYPSAVPPYADDVFTGRFIGGRYVELHSTLAFMLVLINVIPVLIAQLFSKIVFLLVPSLTVSTLSWVHALELLLLATVQCLIAGYFIERIVIWARMRYA